MSRNGHKTTRDKRVPQAFRQTVYSSMVPFEELDRLRQESVSQPRLVREKRQPRKKRHTVLWVLGWIFIFPLPVTLLCANNRKLGPVAQWAIPLLCWALYFLILPG